MLFKIAVKTDMPATVIRNINTLINALRELGISIRYLDLSGANLSGADLSGADLSGADLSEADLSEIKKDLLDVLENNRAEVPALLDALIRGKVDGSHYSGSCCCLVGTIANVKNVDYRTLTPDSDRPAERFFLAINEGDTPENNQVSKIVVEWIREFLGEQETKTEG